MLSQAQGNCSQSDLESHSSRSFYENYLPELFSLILAQRGRRSEFPSWSSLVWDFGQYASMLGNLSSPSNVLDNLLAEV